MADSETRQTITQRLDKLYEFDRQPVTQDKLQPGRYFAGVFAGEHIAATEFVIGALFVSLGATFRDVLVGLLVGNLLAVMSWTLVCAPIAVKTRLTLYWYLRKIGGPAVTVVYNVLTAVLFCILAGAMITVSASAIRIPFGIEPQTGWVPNDPWFIPLVFFVGAVVVTLAILGFRRLAQFASLCSPWLVVMFVAGALLTISNLGSIRSWRSFVFVAETQVWKGPAAGQSALGFWHVAAFAWICNLATHLGLSDMALFRYARRASYGLYSAFGMFLGHYLAWVCAGIMGASAVAMVNADRFAGGTYRGKMAEMGAPLRARTIEPPIGTEADADADVPMPTPTPGAPKAKGGMPGKAPPTPTLAVPKAKGGMPGKAPPPRGGAPDKPAPDASGSTDSFDMRKAKAKPDSSPMKPVPASSRPGPKRPAGVPAPEPGEEADSDPGSAEVRVAEISDLDSGEVAFRSLHLIGAIVVVLAGWTTANPTLYRAGLALQAVTPGWSRWRVTAMAGVVTTLVACSPFVFLRLHQFVAICGIVLVPIGAIVVAEHWLFPRLGLTQFWSMRKRQTLNWPALASWMGGVALAAAAWISKYAFDCEVLHEFFLVIPVWIVTTLLYVVLAACAGARETLPDLDEEPCPAPPPAPKIARGAVRLRLAEKRLLVISGLAAAASLGYWLWSAIEGHRTMEVASYEDQHKLADELGYHHLVFLVSAVVFLYLWEKSLPWRPVLYYAAGLMALGCLALCVFLPLCVFQHWIMDTHAKSHLIPISLGYFIAALTWLRQREKKLAMDVEEMREGA